MLSTYITLMIEKIVNSLKIIITNAEKAFGVAGRFCFFVAAAHPPRS